MIRYLTRADVLRMHDVSLLRYGGLAGIRDVGAFESAVAQPEMTFGGEDLYPSIFDKAAALGFSLIRNHPFLDGNKRTGWLAMERFLALNGWHLSPSTDDAYDVVIRIAQGELDREQLSTWLQDSSNTE